MTTLLAEKPFAGAVFCFTSVSPDLRTEYAQYAVEMGAEHKLDLTSDVTHLLVGDTDTAKYKYVAREREDVKVLRPDYVPAVRTKWMDAQTVDIASLEHEYRLLPFHGLKICITGFDDLSFRQQLQQNILENGGQYSGDLTKDITHLIAVQAQGKKYEYAIHWQIKVVSLKWYKDTLSRGMQLDETLYHPAKPIDEQGIGAWTRRSETKQNLGKRLRQETTPVPRKLRRTASSRLGSQTDNIWSNIVNAPTSDTDAYAKPALRQSKSMSALKADPNLPPNELLPALSGKQDYFTGKYFLIARFDQQKSLKLRHIITVTGGVVLNSTHELRNTDSTPSSLCLLMVPWQSASEDIPHVPGTEIVSELWLEYCMEQKTFIPASDYIYGSLLSSKKLVGFSQLSIASNGFAGIQVRHLSKVTVALGARYSEVFDSSTTILICKVSSENPNRKMKMRRAQAWAVPVVSERWLEACIQKQQKVPLEPYLLQPWRAVQEPKAMSIYAQENGGEFTETRKEEQQLINQPSVPTGQGDDKVKLDQALPMLESRPDSNKSDIDLTTVLHQNSNEGARDNGYRALKEISPNSPGKQPSPDKSVKPKKRLFQTADGSSSLRNQIQPLSGNADPVSIPGASPSAPAPSITDARTLNGEIQDLLNIKARAKASIETAAAAGDTSKSLVGRALSNLSNGSVPAHRKLSRASSVDSMNTDGVGSEICLIAVQSQETIAAGQHAFTGRAKSRLLDGTTAPASPPASTSASASAPVELTGMNPAISLSIEDLSCQCQSEDQPPALTQLVYDDPDEAILLREKLAAKRRARGRLGQKESDPRPEVLRELQQQQQQSQQGPKKLKDDDMLATAGWGVTGRTRGGGKVKLPDRLNGF
ncbi:hypothetical protein DV736_g853, partial [Chaetothyriales sp. CBS 134916]